MSKIKIVGFLVLLVYGFLSLSVLQGNLGAAMFLVGVVYGLILIFHKPLERVISSRVQHLLFTYGVLIFLGGMFVESLAILNNLGRITAGERVFLFSSTPWKDLLIAVPHYIAVGATWAWVLKRYKISPFEQALIIWLFWSTVLDNFIHLKALVAGNIFDFIVAGLIMVLAFNWVLILFKNKFAAIYPNRKNTWIKYPVTFFMQIIPIVVLIFTAVIMNSVFGK